MWSKSWSPAPIRCGTCCRWPANQARFSGFCLPRSVGARILCRCASPLRSMFRSLTRPGCPSLACPRPGLGGPTLCAFPSAGTSAGCLSREACVLLKVLSNLSYLKPLAVGLPLWKPRKPLCGVVSEQKYRGRLSPLLARGVLVLPAAWLCLWLYVWSHINRIGVPPASQH